MESISEPTEQSYVEWAVKPRPLSRYNRKLQQYLQRNSCISTLTGSYHSKPNLKIESLSANDLFHQKHKSFTQAISQGNTFFLKQKMVFVSSRQGKVNFLEDFRNKKVVLRLKINQKVCFIFLCVKAISL